MLAIVEAEEAPPAVAQQDRHGDEGLGLLLLEDAPDLAGDLGQRRLDHFAGLAPHRPVVEPPVLLDDADIVVAGIVADQ